jgi:hypothetical protein
MDELKADTGKLVPGFGNEGKVNLNDQLRGPASENRVSMTSPAGIYKDILDHPWRRGRNDPGLSGRSPRLGRPQWQTALDLPRETPRINPHRYGRPVIGIVETVRVRRDSFPIGFHTASTGGKACKHLWQAGFSFNAARTVMNIRCSW